jgi:hypothetical protein
MNHSRRTLGRILVSLGLAAVGLSSLGCVGAIVHTRGDATALIPNVTAVVALNPKLGFGRAVEQHRTARRTGDTLIEVTGGHAILAEELSGSDPELIADGVRSLGENPEQTLTFSVTGAREERTEAVSVVTSGSRRSVRRYVDYMVRLDVRRSDSADILGSVETFATCFANEPEIDARGQPRGLQKAIDDAIRAALKSFAPHLIASAPFPTLAEVPAQNDEAMQGGALADVDKLRKLQVLYPELTPDDLAALASSNARFLVIKPGRLAVLGLTTGDLLSGTGGRTLGSRAALARTLARGDTPAMSVDRVGKRFLVGQTLVARAR